MLPGVSSSKPFRRLAQPPAAPVLQVTLYYLVLGALLAAIAWLFPGVAERIPIDAAHFAGWGGSADVFRPVAPETATEVGGLATAVSLTVSMAGALLLMLPVSWVYMGTRVREGYDPALIQTILVLPIAVAGIVIVVQNSLPLAFSLAGIVAIIRFRTTLKDTSDALFLFVAIGVGLSAGIGALGIGIALSLFFNYTNLAVWKLDYGSEGSRKQIKKAKKAKKQQLEADAAEPVEIERI